VFEQTFRCGAAILLRRIVKGDRENERVKSVRRFLRFILRPVAK
jgi:hypothetical protein